jgi:hypothetical protein
VVLENSRGRQAVYFILFVGSKIRVVALGGKCFVLGSEAKIRVGHSWWP